MGARELIATSRDGRNFWTDTGFTRRRSAGRVEWNKGIRIETVRARQVLDSRGNPTVEADVTLRNGAFGRAIVPSGASTGELETLELRDGDPDVYLGQGTTKAVANVNDRIAPAVRGLPVFEQERIDGTMIEQDGTGNKAGFGANAILAVSMAAVRAATYARFGTTGFPYRYVGGEDVRTMPVPMCNNFNGGAHGDWVTDIQEFMAAPAGARSFPQALQWSADLRKYIGKVLKAAGYDQGRPAGNEGGYTVWLDGRFYTKVGHRPVEGINAEPLWVFLEAVTRMGLTPGEDIVFTLDGAVSALEKSPGQYTLARDGRTLSSAEFSALYGELVRHVRGPRDQQVLRSVEDGLSESDWTGWAAMNRLLGKDLQLVLDDPTCTNPELLARAIAESSGNAVLIKLNQIGSVTETIRAIRMAQAQGWGVVVSHRSGETEDPFIADLAVATDAGQIKTGSVNQADRIAKYNQLLRINADLEARGCEPVYPGASVYTNRQVYDRQFPG